MRKAHDRECQGAGRPGEAPRFRLRADLATALLGALLLGCASDGAPAPIDPATALRDPNPAVRQKAAREAGARGDERFVPELIELLDDPDPGVRLTAHGALERLTGRRPASRPYDEPARRREEVESWRAWYTARGVGAPRPREAP
jgi:hypothetical protein